MHNFVASLSSAGELFMTKSGCLKCKNVIQNVRHLPWLRKISFTFSKHSCIIFL